MDGIELKQNELYIIIDALYVNTISDNFKTYASYEQIRKDAFPYCDTPFVEYYSTEKFFNPSKIKQVDYEEASEDYKSFLSTDTAILLFINHAIFWGFLADFDFNKLVESELDLEYWKKIISKYNKTEIAMLTSDDECELDGSGTYMIV